MKIVKNTVAIALAATATIAAASIYAPRFYAPVAVHLGLPLSEEVKQHAPDQYLKALEKKMRQNYKEVGKHRKEMMRQLTKIENEERLIKERSDSVDNWLSTAKSVHNNSPETDLFQFGGKDYSTTQFRLQIASLLQEQKSLEKAKSNLSEARSKIEEVITKLNSAHATYAANMTIIRTQQSMVASNEIASSLIELELPEIDSLVADTREVEEYLIRTTNELDMRNISPPQEEESGSKNEIDAFLNG